MHSLVVIVSVKEDMLSAKLKTSPFADLNREHIVVADPKFGNSFVVVVSAES